MTRIHVNTRDNCKAVIEDNFIIHKGSNPALTLVHDVALRNNHIYQVPYGILGLIKLLWRVIVWSFEAN